MTDAIAISIGPQPELFRREGLQKVVKAPLDGLKLGL
jgi:hypothetical protein